MQKSVKNASRWEDATVYCEGKITSFEERNRLAGGKFKNVFLLSGARRVILWDRTTAQAGDTVILKGRIVNGIFLAWRMLILKRSPVLITTGEDE